jgi:hypothetical protein
MKNAEIKAKVLSDLTDILSDLAAAAGKESDDLAVVELKIFIEEIQTTKKRLEQF